VLAQMELWQHRDRYDNQVYVLPKHLDEKVAAAPEEDRREAHPLSPSRPPTSACRSRARSSPTTTATDLPGNHDDPGQMRGLLDRAPFSLCATPIIGDWRVVMLSSRVARSPAGRLGGEELARLDAVLSACDHAHALVCVHHQPLPMGSRWLDRHMLADAEAFRGVIAAHPQVRGVLWGHVHQVSDRQIDGVRWLSTPATCGQFLPGSRNFASDTRPPAWRWLALHPDGDIDTEVCWLDRQ
jgi:3',5'-cyclic-AMP phosphodiesterase